MTLAEQAEVVARVRANMNAAAHRKTGEKPHLRRWKTEARFRRATDGKAHKVTRQDGVAGYIVETRVTCPDCSQPWEPVERDRHGTMLGFGCQRCGGSGKRVVRTWSPFEATS